jgi:cytochrome c oxidase cbb3-type subunit 3
LQQNWPAERAVNVCPESKYDRQLHFSSGATVKVKSMRPQTLLAPAAFALLASIAVQLGAQAPQQAPPTAPAGNQGRGGPPQGRGRGATFPAQQRPPGDPEQIKRGAGLYGVYCRACHGTDLRGGDQGGPNLLRSQIVLNDQDGESIGPVVLNGRQNPGMPVMPPLAIPADDVKAIATYIRSVLATARGQGAPPEGAPLELNIVVGDAKAGEEYFSKTCTACHSAANMKGIATRVSNPMALQNYWVGGGGGGRGRGAQPATPVTVIVTDASGQTFEGRLIRLDDFGVAIGLADGTSRSWRRDGDVPKVEVRDPREAHRKLLPNYADRDIHNVTAYLVTLK